MTDDEEQPSALSIIWTTIWSRGQGSRLLQLCLDIANSLLKKQWRLPFHLYVQAQSRTSLTWEEITEPMTLHLTSCHWTRK